MRQARLFHHNYHDEFHKLKILNSLNEVCVNTETRILPIQQAFSPLILWLKQFKPLTKKSSDILTSVSSIPKNLYLA